MNQLIRLKYQSTCNNCKKVVYIGDKAYFNAINHKIICKKCYNKFMNALKQ